MDVIGCSALFPRSPFSTGAKTDRWRQGWPARSALRAVAACLGLASCQTQGTLRTNCASGGCEVLDADSADENDGSALTDPRDEGDSDASADADTGDGDSASADGDSDHDQVTDSDPEVGCERALNILFIGNSFTYGGPVPTLVQQLAMDAQWPTPAVTMVANGGWTLEMHRADAASVAAVDIAGNEPQWDYVVVQEYSTRPTDAPPGAPEQFKTDATWFYDRIKATSPAAMVVLYETWAREASHVMYTDGSYASPAEMQAELHEHYFDAATNYIPTHSTSAVTTDLFVAPAGDAWEVERTSASPVRLHDTDNYHAGVDGQYLNALVIYSSIYGVPVSGLTTLGRDANATHLQAVADAVTLKSGALRPCLNALFFPVGHAVRFDFGPTATTEPGWNNITSVSGSLSNAVDSDGAATTLDLAITVAFVGSNTEGLVANGLDYPAEVSKDTLWAGSLTDHATALGFPAQVVLRGMPEGQYSISIFASRAGADGANSRLGRYTIGSTWLELDPTDNTDQQIVFTGVTPDAAGTVTIDVAVSPASNSRFAYVGALLVSRTE